jgi:hypothetical protein
VLSGTDYSLAHNTQAEKAIYLLANHKKMSEIKERYVNPFTDFGRFAVAIQEVVWR